MDSRYTYASPQQFTSMNMPPMLPGYTPVFMNVPQSYTPIVPYSPLFISHSSADLTLPAIDSNTSNGMVSLSPVAPLFSIPISDHLHNLPDDDTSSTDQQSVNSEPSLVCHSPYQMYTASMMNAGSPLMNAGSPLMNAGSPLMAGSPIIMSQFMNAPMTMPMGVTVHPPQQNPRDMAYRHHNRNMAYQHNTRDMTYQNNTYAHQYLAQPKVVPSSHRVRVSSVGSDFSDSGSFTSGCDSDSDSHNNKVPISKRDLVFKTLDWLKEQFKENYDNEGERGQNVLRIKVKTRDALEHICSFIEKCMAENLIQSVSCPISTKKGRQHVRGYLLYAKAANEKNANRIAEIFDKHNEKNGRPFKQLHRNPVSTLNKQKK